MLDDFDDKIPVTCDKVPTSIVNWYNKVSKTIVSDEHYYANPTKKDDFIKINLAFVDRFYLKAK